MKTTTKIGMIGLGSLLLVSGAAAASSETRQQVRAALENNDYDAYVAIERDGRVLTEEVFNLKADLLDARESGDDAQVQELKDELSEIRDAKKAERQENREARRAAIESENYNDFLATVPETKEAPSEEVFELIVDLSEAREAGDEERASEIKQELRDAGFEKPNKKRGGKRGGDSRGVGNR